MPSLELSVRPTRTTLFLAGGAFLLGLAFAVTKILIRFFDFEMGSGLFRFFDLGQEVSLPTFYSSLLLLTAAVLLWLIAVVERVSSESPAWPWFLLAAGFLFMAVDESASIHEGIVGSLAASVLPEQHGIWNQVWYIPFIPVIILLLIVFVPFLRRIQRRFSLLFLTAGGIYLSGAIGMEMVESYIRYNQIAGLESISVLVEESLEMFGVIVFIYALMRYLDEYHEPIQIRFLAGTKPPTIDV